MSEFMKELNHYLHAEDETPDEHKQRDIFKAFVTVTLRQNLTQLSTKIQLFSAPNILTSSCSNNNTKVTFSTEW